MVLFKRKPFALLPSPASIPEDAQVFVMRGTNEVFVDYEKYLKRLDYLNQKKFVDAVNGKSGLTFFDALESENDSTNAIETVFPEVLRGPILRRVQFATISRIDDLVNGVYDEYKREFFPGEEVIVQLQIRDEQREGTIREKAKFPKICAPNGDVQRPAFSRYFITLHDETGDEVLVDDKHVRRDRKVFTKQNLRAFLKHSLQRESWIGAPWLVKEHLAIHYRLQMEIPAHLLYGAKLLSDKQAMLEKQHRKRTKTFDQDEFKRLQAEQYELSRQQQKNGTSIGHHPVNSGKDAKQPQIPLIKYPIEDLDIAPKRNGVVRPSLEFFTDEMAKFVKNGRQIQLNDISMESMGMLLEVWNTLNVQCEVYKLDSFTFDDFVDAMRYQLVDPPCELLDEAFCAVLKVLVDDKGNLNLAKNTLPEMISESEESSDEQQDESEVSTPLPDAPARSTRSRLSQIDPSTGLTEKAHRAVEMLGERDWTTRLRAQEFISGGWQVILVGLLYQLSLSPAWKHRADKILAWLAPTDADPTKETARFQFANMDINLRISALQIITMLSLSTMAIKDFLEACNDDMTDVRKRKIEYQKAKRIAMEELQVKDRERKILLPDNMLPDTPTQGSVEPISINGDTEESIEVNGIGSSDPDDDDAPKSGRSLRRGNDRKRKRDEEAARVAEEKRKADLAKQQPKQSKEFKKLLTDIDELKKQIMESERKIVECDGDLREANVQRTKVLGRDRFCNRYYWFERNGQPFGGIPSSSTAHYGYANGRIWVQGPDELEKSGLIDRSPEEQKEYQKHFGLTVTERRSLEEGNTVLQSAHEWGYCDDPVLLDNLIGWLDDRGEREKRLRKELCEWRDTIVQYMEAHKKFRDEEAARKMEVDEEAVTRISTRHRAQEDQTASRERCLKWTNSMAIDKIGHLHSQPEKPKPKQKVAIRPPKGVAVPVVRTRQRG